MAQQKPGGSRLDKYRAAKETIRELEKAARQELIEKYHALIGRSYRDPEGSGGGL
jgi:hypothetical protein